MPIFNKKISTMEKKICTKCKKEKELKYFFKTKNKKSGYRPECKECWKKVNNRWKPSNVENRKFAVLKYSTGVTKEQYKKFLLIQNNSCAICKKEFSMDGTKLAVDHCHTTKHVRGLLCNECNIAIGAFKDNIELLQAAINYLQNPINIGEIIIHKEKDKYYKMNKTINKVGGSHE